jgi:hypothetical protein
LAVVEDLALHDADPEARPGLDVVLALGQRGEELVAAVADALLVGFAGSAAAADLAERDHREVLLLRIAVLFRDRLEHVADLDVDLVLVGVADLAEREHAAPADFVAFLRLLAEGGEHQLRQPSFSSGGAPWSSRAIAVGRGRG